MGPELIAGIIGPVLGGTLSLVLWSNKKNSDHLEKGFERVSLDLQRVERCVTDMRVEVAKNYITKEEVAAHLKDEEVWHAQIHAQMDDIRTDLRDVRNNVINER